jgi:hypothetical protein
VGKRAVLLIPAAFIAAALTFACGSVDPDGVTVEPGHGGSQSGPGYHVPADGGGGGGKTPGADGAAMGDSQTVSHDGKDGGTENKDTGGGGGADGPTLEDAAAAAIFGSTTYSAMSVTTSATMLHQMKGGPKNVIGTDCLSCHNGATKGTAEFLFAGTIYNSPDGGGGAETIEVRVIDDKKNGVSTYSDTDGDFWSEATAALAVPGATGARNAVAEQIMPQALASGDCNSCHNGKAQALMHVP